MPLFNIPKRGMLLTFSRLPTGYDNDDNNHSALINRQCQTHADIDTHTNIPFLPKGSTVGLQQEERGPWMHGTVVGHGTGNLKGRNYKV